MGKREQVRSKLDSWLGRGFKASQLKSLLGLTVSRLAVLRNQRRARCNQARGDVAEFLRQGHHERALLRAEYVIREQNMLDAFAMVESCCHVVEERAVLLENQKGCPDELREAISSLIFAGSRCGELPELNEVRSIFASRLGKEFVLSAVELRNSCGVNPRIIQKLSTKQPSRESRVQVTKDIAAEVGIVLQLEEPSSDVATAEPNAPSSKQTVTVADDLPEVARDEYLSESVKMRQRYKDAASAAQAAFESAAYAAAAARAAVELSRSESQGKGSSGDHGSPRGPARTTSDDWNRRTPPQVDTPASDAPAFEKVHPVQAGSSESDSEQEVEPGNKALQNPGEAKYASPSCSKSGDLHWSRVKGIAYDTSEEEDESEEEGKVELERNAPGPTTRRVDSGNGTWRGIRKHSQFDASSDEDTFDDGLEVVSPPITAFRRQSPVRQQGNREQSQYWQRPKTELRCRRDEDEEKEEEEEEGLTTHNGDRPKVVNAGGEVAEKLKAYRLGKGKGPVSLRTRRSGI